MKRLTFLIGVLVIGCCNFSFSQDTLINEQLPYLEICKDIEDKVERQKCSDENMIRIIMENIAYPESARKNSIKGVVVVSFVINNEGLVDSLIIRRDIGHGCGQAAVTAIKNLPRFIPAKQYGEIVSMQINMPIRFGLGNQQKKRRRKHNKPNN